MMSNQNILIFLVLSLSTLLIVAILIEEDTVETLCNAGEIKCPPEFKCVNPQISSEFCGNCSTNCLDSGVGYVCVNGVCIPQDPTELPPANA